MDRFYIINKWLEMPIWVKIIIPAMILATAIFFLSCNTRFGKSYPQDNIVEEIIEELIESKTGLDIDLSPNSPEISEKNRFVI